MLNKEINELSVAAFIESRKKSLTKEKKELQKKFKENKSFNSNQSEITLYESANRQVRTSYLDDDSYHPMEKNEITRSFFNFGESENQQQKLKDERKRDYAEYLAEREKKISAYKSSLDDKYNDMVQQKKKDEENYRIQMGDVLKESSKKKVIVFDSDEEELFQQVLQVKNRVKSADETKRVMKLNEQKRSSTFDNSHRSTQLFDNSHRSTQRNADHKSYPFLSIFEDSSCKDSLKAEKSKQYKKELEDQIKEKENLKMREKLQRLGRINSDSESYEKKPCTQPAWLPNFVSAQSKDAFNANDSTKLFSHRNQTPMHYQNSAPPVNYMIAPPVDYMTAPPVGYVTAPPVGYMTAPPDNYFPTHPLGYSGSQPYIYPPTKYGSFPVNASFTAANMQLRPTEPVAAHPVFKSFDAENIPRRGNNQPPGGVSSNFMGSSYGSSEDIEISRAKKLAYSNDLNKQMELKKLSAKKEKDERERYYKKLETEVYDPWGKGGAGAPMKNAKGEIVADLRKFRHPSPVDHNLEESGSTVKTFERDSYDNTKSTNLKNVVSTQDTVSTTTYARGAALQELKGQTNMNPSDKFKQDDYKMFLKQQVEEKKRKEQELKEKIRLEEEKENQRLLEQQRKMKEDFDKEKERQRQKEEELCRQNEELRLLAEQRRLKEDKKEKETIDANFKKETDYDNKILVSEKTAVRNVSPPVPAVMKGKKNIENANKEKIEKQEAAIHTSFSQQEALIEQLAALRKQLQDQENKVKKDLERNKSQQSITQSSSKKHAKPLIKKGLETVLIKNVAEMQNNGMNETSSLFDSNLLTHQEEYMREQEMRLMRLREGLEKNINHKLPKTEINNQSLLQSDSTFMPLNQHFKENNAKVMTRRTLNNENENNKKDNKYENDFKTHFKHFFDSSG